MRVSKKWLIAATTCISMILLAMGLLALEWILRSFPVLSPRPYFVIDMPRARSVASMFIPDSEIGWRMRPHFRNEYVTINSQGFRNLQDFDAETRPIVFVGDSFTFGTGVRDHEVYPAIVE